MKLQDAMDSLSLHKNTTHKLVDFSEEIGMVLAAIRAYQCKLCRGTGKEHHANSDTMLTCRACDIHRRIGGLK